MNKNKIAIILVNYNGTNDTIECIESIKKSTYDNYKVIVVDNASPEKDCKKITKKFPDVKLIESKENLGFSGGNNLGIKYALENDFDYIMLLNNDTIIDNLMINELLKNSDKNTITAPKMYYYKEKNRIWYAGGKIDKITGSVKHYKMNEIDNNEDKISNVTFATGCCMMINADIIKRIGMLNDSYFMYCEDTDFCLNALSNNIKILYIPNAKLWHKVSVSSGGEGSPFSTYYITRNRFYYISKYKNYFAFTAMLYSFITRYIRILQYKFKKNNIWKSIKKGVYDYKKKINGKVDKYF